MSVEDIFSKYEVLTASEIAIVRSKINDITDEQKKEDLFQELQTKVAYRNQKDNVNAPYGTCNVTSLAMAFDMLGVSKEDFVNKVEGDIVSGVTIPQNVKDGDYEDLLDFIRREKEFGPRIHASSWDELAKYIGLSYEHRSAYSSKNKPELTAYLSERLRAGDGVVMSIAYEKGHIVRLQEIDNNRVIIDDPYGEVNSLAKREFKGLNSSGDYNQNSKDMSTTGKKGENCTVLWNEFNVSVEQGKGGSEEMNADELLTYTVNGITVIKSFEEWLERVANQNIDEYLLREETVVENSVTAEGTITSTLKYYVTKGATIKYYRIYSKPSENEN